MKRLFACLAWIPLAALMAASPTFAAESQILGVIASADPIPFTCDERECTVEISSFCLQERKAVPDEGTPYRLASAPGGAFGLVDRGDSGATPVALTRVAMRFTAARANRAVTMSIDREIVDRLGLEDAALVVGDGVSLVPDSLLDRSDEPAIAQEIELTTGPLRQVGIAYVDRAGASIAAVRTLGVWLNVVPDTRRGDLGDRTVLLSAIAGSETEGDAIARSVFARCDDPGNGFMTFRQCLASHHDHLLDPANRAYWAAVGAGS